MCSIFNTFVSDLTTGTAPYLPALEVLTLTLPERRRSMRGWQTGHLYNVKFIVKFRRAIGKPLTKKRSDSIDCKHLALSGTMKGGIGTGGEIPQQTDDFVFPNSTHFLSLCRRYKELLQFLQEEEGTKGSSLRRGKKGTNTRDDFSKCLGLALWLNEQRRLYNDGVQGKIHEMRDDRARKLEKINFSLVDFSIQGVGLSAIPKRAIALPVPPGLTKKSSVEAVSTRRAASTATKKSSSVPPNADPRETAVPDDVTRKQVLHKDHPVVAYVTPYNSTHRMWNYPASPSSAGSPVKPIALGDAMRFEEKTPDIAGKPPIANVCVSPVSNADDSAAAKTISSMETSQQAKAIGKLPAQ